MLSHRFTTITEPAALQLLAQGARVKKAGGDIINLATGEPDFDTPAHITDACVDALRTKRTTHYDDPRGMLSLREAVCARFARDYAVRYAPDEIIVTCGGLEGLSSTLLLLIDRGDEVIIPSPFWGVYKDQVTMCEGTSVLVPTSAASRFVLTADALSRAITPRTKAVLLNNPCNPTGSVYHRDELAALARVCHEGGLWIISDEVYADLVYAPATFTSVAAVAPEHHDRTIIISSVSKSYAMTGWRIGCVAAPVTITDALAIWHMQSVIHPPVFAQYGAIAALTGDLTTRLQMRETFRRRRDVVVAWAQTMPDLPLIPADGTFYAFLNVAAYLHAHTRIATAQSLIEHLLDTAGVLLAPGECFGASGYVRLSYALDERSLRVGLQRLAAALTTLQSA